MTATSKKLTFKQKILKAGSWLLLTVGPAIVAAVFVVFSYGRTAQGYIDDIEDSKSKIIILEPLLERVKKNDNDILSITSSLDSLQFSQNEDRKILGNVDKNLVALMAVLEERKKNDEKSKEDLRIWMNRIEDRLNSRR